MQKNKFVATKLNAGDQNISKMSTQQRTYYVTLEDGTKVSVTKKIYNEYYRPEWCEAKCRQRDRKRLLSGNYIYKTSTGKSFTLFDFIPDSAPTSEEQVIRKQENECLYKAIEKLNENERALIKALFFDQKSERDYSAETGVSRTTINSQKKRALKKLLSYLESSK